MPVHNMTQHIVYSMLTALQPLVVPELGHVYALVSDRGRSLVQSPRHGMCGAI
jgi:hypothetical protein